MLPRPVAAVADPRVSTGLNPATVFNANFAMCPPYVPVCRGFRRGQAYRIGRSEKNEGSGRRMELVEIGAGRG